MEDSILFTALNHFFHLFEFKPKPNPSNQKKWILWFDLSNEMRLRTLNCFAWFWIVLLSIWSERFAIWRFGAKRMMNSNAVLLAVCRDFWIWLLTSIWAPQSFVIAINITYSRTCSCWFTFAAEVPRHIVSFAFIQIFYLLASGLNRVSVSSVMQNLGLKIIGSCNHA